MSAATPSRHRPASVVTLSPWQQQQAAAVIRAARQILLAEDLDLAADPQLWLDTLDGESNAIDINRALVGAAIDAGLWADVTGSARPR